MLFCSSSLCSRSESTALSDDSSDRLCPPFIFEKWPLGCGSKYARVVLLLSLARLAAAEGEERKVDEAAPAPNLWGPLILDSSPWESDSEEALSRISSSILLKEATWSSSSAANFCLS